MASPGTDGPRRGPLTNDPARRFVELVAGRLGVPVDAADFEDPEVRSMLEEALGPLLDDPAALANLERTFDEASALPTDAETDAFLTVDEVFQTAIDRLGVAAFEPSALAAQTPGLRMLLATRGVEAEVGNGGWPAVYYNGMDGLLPLGIAGYRLLGLEEHARIAEEALAHGFDLEAEDDAFWDRLDTAWSALPSAERRRAEYFVLHPAEFGKGI